MKNALLLGGAMAAFGCSGGSSVDIGDDKAATRGQRLEDFAGLWDGYAELFTFSDDSDRIRIELDASGQGTLQVGELPLYPPPSAFDIGYPPGSEHFEYLPYHLEPGLLYPIHEASVETLRIRLALDAHAPFRQWCQMQTPRLEQVDYNTGMYQCVVGSVDFTNPCVITDPVTQVAMQLDCGKVRMCQAVCACTETECGLLTELGQNATHSNVLVDATLANDGTVLDGTLAQLLGPFGDTIRIPIRLTHQ